MHDKDENIVYYLKYRPQSLNSLVGQDLVKKTLISAFINGKLAHAYLLVGPRGTGKTSTARILAKMVNCEASFVIPSKEGIYTDNGSPIPPTGLPRFGEAGEAGESGMTNQIPCNKCSACISITDGSNLDLIEIDAASNRGIDDIRQLRERVKLSPTSAKKKVYVIDEAHMLTTEAFNALLKTLEEPPKHALFILATTEASKIPQTILSRVQRLDFKLATQIQLLEALQNIVTKERINIDEQALKFLVKKAAGSFRDGIKLLDQISSIEGKLTVDILESFFKSSNFDNLLTLLNTFVKKDIKEALSIITKEVEAGIDIKELTTRLMDILRNIVFIKNGLGEQLVKDNFGEGEYEVLIRVSDYFENKNLVSDLDILQTALEKMKTTPIAALPLEMAAIEICEEETGKKLEVRSEKIDEEIGNLKLEKKAIVSENPTSNLQFQDPDSNIQQPISNNDIFKLKEKWTFVLETVRPYNFSLEALLRSINVVECRGNTVVIEVPYSFHQRILEAPKNRDLLESIFSDILGRGIKVATILGVRPKSHEDIANIEVAADDEIIRAAAEIFSSDTIN